jgi:tetratricopeptide (TPR) repeat protein
MAGGTSDAEVDKPEKDTLLMGGDEGWDSLDEEIDSEATDDADESEAGEQEESGEGADDADDDADSEDDEDDEDVDADESKSAEEKADEDDESDDDVDEAGDTVGKMAAAGIGSVEVDGDGGGADMSDDWFGKSHEETWETQQVEAVEQKSENLIRYATIGVFALLGLGVLGFYIFVETGDDAAADKTDAGEEVAASESADDGDTRDVDLDRLKGNFDSAISGDRLITPRDNSAIKYLEELERHGEDSDQYAEAREVFVEEARTRAEDIQDEELYAARNLAGAAAQFSDDGDVKSFAEELDKKWRASSGADSTDVGAKDDDEASETEEEEPSSEKSEPPTARTTEKRAERRKSGPDAPPRKPPKSAGDDSSGSSGNSVSSLLRQAKAAEASGDSAKAKRLYRKVLNQSSSNSRALSALGGLYFDDAAYSQAAKYYERAVRSSGGNMGYRLRLGMTYYKLGQFERARDTWQDVLDREPGNSRAQQYIKLVESKIN